MNTCRDESPTPSRRELVVMVHGIASTRFVFAVMNARLRAAGFATRMWGYPSILWSNTNHGASLARLLRRLAATGKYDTVHLVVHSMGSIVARCALREELPPQMGRIVMIGPPNQGSHMATYLTPVYGWLAPTLVELRDVEGSFVRTLPAPPEGVEIGVIAAERDRMVPLLNTHLPGMRDHIVLPGFHTSSLWRRETAAQVIHFLRTGRFLPPGEPAASADGVLSAGESGGGLNIPSAASEPAGSNGLVRDGGVDPATQHRRLTPAAPPES